MSIRGKACVAGVYEHPTRQAADKSVFQLHAEVAQGAPQDAGLSMRDVDGYFCAGDARIGQRVKVCFRPSDGGPPVPMFTPAQAVR